MRRSVLLPALAVLAAGCSRGPVPGGPPVRVSGPASAPQPEVLERGAARHPPCGIVPLGESGTAATRLRADPAVSLRLPSGFRPTDGAEEGPMQSWLGADSTLLTVAVSAGGSFDLGIEGATEIADGGECSHAFAGRLSTVGRMRLVPPMPRDTVYMATVNVPHQADRYIGAGIVSRTAAGREHALAALATLRVDER